MTAITHFCMSSAQNEGVTPWFSPVTAGIAAIGHSHQPGGFHAIFGQVVCCRSFRGSDSLPLSGAYNCPNGPLFSANFPADPAYPVESYPHSGPGAPHE